MKNLLLLLAILSFSLQNSKHIPVDYIAIVHTGKEEKPVESLVVSKEKISLAQIYESVPVSSIKFGNLVITNNKTFSIIVDFVNNNQAFFTNNINKNNGDFGDFSIIINGKAYNIFYKLRGKFFAELIKNLKVQDGDKYVIKKLNIY